jgi:hypothetical protein
MSDSELNTERKSIRTYVPAYQRDEWDEHADELNMSRSEFVKTMVQAGRRGFESGKSGFEDTQAESGSHSKSQPNPGKNIRDPLEEQVLEALSTEQFYTWDELLSEITENMEDRLETVLQDLQTSNRVRYSGRNGGYTLDEQ